LFVWRPVYGLFPQSEVKKIITLSKSCNRHSFFKPPLIDVTMSATGSPPPKMRPKTVDEAQRLMQAAINEGDFEGAKLMAEEVASLQNFEAEVGLAKAVHGYYQNKQALSSTMDENCRLCSEKTKDARSKAEKFYRSEFLKMKKRHEDELEDLIRKWDDSRVDALGDAQSEFNRTMTTAKLLARRLNFDEAMRMRKEATEVLKDRSRHSPSDVNALWYRQGLLLLSRQQEELNVLIERKNLEFPLLETSRETAETQLRETFFLDNANTVMEIASTFPNTGNSFIPHSLRMQAVRGRPDLDKDVAARVQITKELEMKPEALDL
jgi:hypothetical protein